MKNKVFCIGLSKTGTSSLAAALEYMGYHVGRRQFIFKQHFPDLDLIEAINAKNYQAIFRIIPKFDAFVDNPWPLLYQNVASQYPDAKFILTTREADQWLQSARTYFGNSKSDFRKLTYGYAGIQGNEQIFLNKYKNHHQSVVEFFQNEPERLLVLPLESSNKWKLLADFLDTETPNIPYPKVNKTERTIKPFKWLKILNPIYIEVLFTLSYARLLTLRSPFKKVAKKMSNPLSKQSSAPKSEQLGRAIKLAQILKSLSKKVPFRTKCFEQALGMQTLLKRRGIPSNIIFGLQSENDQLAAHAWCMCYDITLTGEKGKERFNVIKSFSND